MGLQGAHQSKHLLLEKYLRAWIPILGKYHQRVSYFDGFAGRGEWGLDSPGSPVIAIEVAHELEPYFTEFVCTNIELDPDNFQNLESVLKSCDYPKIVVKNRQGAFANVMAEILAQEGDKLGPSFFFIDPFGFSGVPLSTIRDILSIGRTEVFITFMYRDINRFLENATTKEALGELYGETITDLLQGATSIDENALRDLYIWRLQNAAHAKFVWPFRVSMTEERRTLYYLIYATNHFKGLMLMKSIMYNQGAGGDFCYLGPEDGARRIQPSFFDGDTQPLRDLLLERFKGQILTYDQIEEETWAPPFIDKHYRAVLKALEDAELVSVNRVSSKRTGLKGKDQISFR